MPRKLAQRQPPHRDPDYLDFIRAMPCHVGGEPGPSDPHHIISGGVGQKCSDHFTVPLCRKHHREVQSNKPIWLANMALAALEYLSQYVVKLKQDHADDLDRLAHAARAERPAKPINLEGYPGVLTVPPAREPF